MQSLEAACEEGERSYKKLKSNRTSLPLPRPQETEQQEVFTSTKPPFCIFTKLRELYEEETSKDAPHSQTGLKPNSRLLEKLVARERLNTLILNLYPGNKGYSFTFRTTSRTESNTDDTANMIETKQWPYEEDELLRYIDNEELPPYIIDLLEPHFNFLFYSGCVIAEVRDYRQAYPHLTCDIHHVLLRPTLQSILSDVNNIMEEKVEWGTNEKHQLESQMLLARTPQLCLDPDNSVCDIISGISHNRQMWNTHKFRRTAKKFSQVTVNRKRKLDRFTHRHGLELYDYVTKLRSKPKTGHSISNKITRRLHDEIKPIPIPNLDVPLLTPPSHEVKIPEFKAYQRPVDTSDCLPQLIEEYVLETDMPSKEKGKPRVYHIKLSILQRPSDSEYLGELYLDRDHKKNERNGVACRFSLGSRAHANRYIQQFTEIFTESGRKSVRIKYGLSPAYKERVALAQAQVAQTQAQQHAAQVNAAQQHVTQLGQNSQNQSCITSLVNGAVGSSINLMQQNQNTQNTPGVPILQAQLQGSSQTKTSQVSNQEREISAIATRLMNYSQQYQAAANAKQQQQQQQKLASGNNAAIMNLLNSSPVSNINSDASAAVVNAINNSSVLPQVQTINHKLLGRKMTLSHVANARVLNHSNLIAVNNNNRMSLQDLSSHIGQLSQGQQGQTITLTSVNSSNFGHTSYATIKQPVVNQRVLTTNSSDSNKSALSALLAGTAAADRPDIIGPNTNSLLLEKLPNLSSTSPNNAQSPTHFIQSPKSTQQFTVQSPKSNPVISPLSSPPPPNTINLQSVNLAQLSGVPNVQVPLPGFSQSISLALNVSSTGAIQGHPTSLIVTLPVTTATATCTTITQQTASCSVTGANALGVGAPTVVLANTATLAHLVTSGVKGLSQQGLRAAGPAGVTLSQGAQPFQLITPIQRPRMQQANIQHNITARGIQRTPITIKMAAPNATAAQVTLPTNASMSNLASQLQKQAQLQQYQQLCLNQQQKNVSPNVTGKIRRRSNAEPQ